MAAWVPVSLTALNRKSSTNHRQPAWTNIFFPLADLHEWCRILDYRPLSDSGSRGTKAERKKKSSFHEVSPAMLSTQITKNSWISGFFPVAKHASTTIQPATSSASCVILMKVQLQDRWMSFGSQPLMAGKRWQPKKPWLKTENLEQHPAIAQHASDY